MTAFKTKNPEGFLQTTVLSVAIHRKGENPVFGEGSTRVTLEDEAAGPFIVLNQSRDDAKAGEVRLDLEELEACLKAARTMMRQYPNEDVASLGWPASAQPST